MTSIGGRSRATILALGFGAIVALGACSSAATPAPATPAPATPAPATPAPATSAPASATPAPATPAPSPSEAASGTYTLAVVDGGASLGKYLTGEDGKTLYTFTPDSAGKSTCTGGCATNWPPFTLDAGEKAVGGTGVTGKIDTIKRDDGTTQVTYKGLPLYYFAGDSAAGDTNGQGVGGKWFVAAP